MKYIKTYEGLISKIKRAKDDSSFSMKRNSKIYSNLHEDDDKNVIGDCKMCDAKGVEVSEHSKNCKGSKKD